MEKLLALAYLLFVTQSHATSATGETTALALYHFSSTHFGRNVSDVLVHSALLVRTKMNSGGTGSVAEIDAQDAKMAKLENHFFLKLSLSSGNGQNTGMSWMTEGLLVQYKVYLEGQSEPEFSEQVIYPIDSDPRFPSEGFSAARSEFNTVNDTSRTEVTFLNSGMH